MSDTTRLWSVVAEFAVTDTTRFLSVVAVRLL